MNQSAGSHMIGVSACIEDKPVEFDITKKYTLNYSKKCRRPFTMIMIEL